MLLTTNYGLRKPEGTDPVDVQDFNDNADIIDSELKKRPTSTGNASSMTNEFTPTDSLVNLVSGEEQKTLFGKISKAIASLISHLSNKSNPHGVTKAQVGLGSVDNTADANKPVSTAQANAIADAKKAGTDAQGNLTEHTGNKSNPHVVTKSQVGLGNVPNVSTNDQTPTYTDATSVAKLKSGEKLSVAFGKIAKAVSTLISHISTSASTSVAGHVKFGTASGTACQGNDSRLSDSRTPKSHASTGTRYGAGSTSNYGHVKLTDSTAVTDSTGLALPATEKNASIEGTLANQISVLNTNLSSMMGIKIMTSNKSFADAVGSVNANDSYHYADNIATNINQYINGQSFSGFLGSTAYQGTIYKYSDSYFAIFMFGYATFPLWFQYINGQHRVYVISNFS